MSYSILILGTRSGVSGCCFCSIARNMYKHLSKFPHIDVTLGDITDDLHLIDGKDFVLFIGFCTEFDEIRARTPKGRLLSLLEIAIADADWCFSFLKPEIPHATHIVAPVDKEMCVNLPKAKEIVVDHLYYLPDSHDWTFEVSEWLEPLKGEYKIYRMIQYEYDDELEVSSIKPHEIEMPRMLFAEYMEMTSRVETHVFTHLEGYGYSLTDMVARGTRVIAPPNCIHPSLIVRFDIPIFRNREELLALVCSPVEPKWNKMIDRCTDYSEIARIVDDKCQEMKKFPLA